MQNFSGLVATALTVYGIETREVAPPSILLDSALQQRLPFTVLKHDCLSFLKHTTIDGCNSAYRLRY